MAPKNKKAKSWDEVDEDTKIKISKLREYEKEMKIKSGYIKWKKYFIIGFLTYSFLTYKLYFKKIVHKSKNISIGNVSIIFIPPLIYGFVLMKYLYNKEAFQEYYIAHIEMNRLIKKTAESTKYK